MFNGFLSSYKEWVHHGQSIFMSFVSEPYGGSYSDTNVEPNLLAHIDTIETLNDILGYRNKDAFKMITIIMRLTLEIL